MVCISSNVGFRAFVFLFVLAASTARASPIDLTVMTRNLYFGADLTPIATASSPQALVGAVTSVYAQVLASDPAARIARIADEIEAVRPHVVALQEAVLWRTYAPSSLLPTGPGPEQVAFDFVQMMLTELGPSYTLAIKQPTFDALAPGVLGGTLTDIRLTSGDAILVRTDLASDQFKVVGSGGATYASYLTIPIGGAPFNSLRGYTYVDVELSGKQLRIATTQLEPEVAPIRIMQGNELLAALGSSPLPQILLGDLNARADGPSTDAYAKMIAAGFTDAWSSPTGGATCCQAADLRNDPSILDERIDYILHRGDIDVLNVDVIGEALADRTFAGLWPSDHAGLVATLRLLPEPGVLALFGLGFAGLASTRLGIAARRRSQAAIPGATDACWR